jgi:hypothetical protein
LVRQAAKDTGLSFPSTNPFLGIVARSLEVLPLPPWKNRCQFLFLLLGRKNKN